MGGMMEIKTDTLEVCARLFAEDKADSLAGAVAELIFMHLPVTVYHFRDEAEERAEQLVRGLLKLALVEFTRGYAGELERRNEATMKLLRETLDRTPNTTIIHRAGMPKHGEFVVKDVCPKCFHVHEKPDHCGVSMGGGGACDCKAEVRV